MKDVLGLQGNHVAENKIRHGFVQVSWTRSGCLTHCKNGPSMKTSIALSSTTVFFCSMIKIQHFLTHFLEWPKFSVKARGIVYKHYWDSTDWLRFDEFLLFTFSSFLFWMGETQSRNSLHSWKVVQVKMELHFRNSELDWMVPWTRSWMMMEAGRLP